jgi:hypothetical protein
VVEYSTRNSKISGSNSATGTGREKIAKKVIFFKFKLVESHLFSAHYYRIYTVLYEIVKYTFDNLQKFNNSSSYSLLFPMK